MVASSSKPEPKEQQTKEKPEGIEKESKDQVEKKQPVPSPLSGQDKQKEVSKEKPKAPEPKKEPGKSATSEASRAAPGNRNETRVRTQYFAPCRCINSANYR